MNVFAKLREGFTRVFLLAVVVTLASCTATIESGGSPVRQLSLLDRLPAGAAAVAFVDVAAIVAAMPPEDWAEYEEMFRGDDDMRNLERFAEATGMDPREDLRQLALASMAGDEPDEYLLLMAADFDEAKLRDLATDAETVTYEGVELYRAADVFERLEEVVGPVDGDDPAGEVDIDMTAEQTGYLAILDGETLGMGSESGLRLAIDVAAGERDSVASDARMSDLIDGVRDQGQMWLVAGRESWQDRVDDLGAGGGMVPTDAIGSIEVMTMSMRLGDGMALALTGITTDTEAAIELSTSLNGLLAIGRMMMSESEPELLAIVDRGIDVNQQERTVRIEARFTAADIEVLQRLAEEQAARR